MEHLIDHITARRLYWLAALLLVPALLLNLGIQLFYLEEPRRILIGLEMLQNGNLWMPTELGEPYYKKPPLFNWVLLAFGELFGYNEWVLRLPTALATLAMAGLTAWGGARYVDRDFGWQSGLLFVTSAGIFFYFSTLAEIDLVYSLITFGSFLAFFHFYRQERYYPAFLLAFFLAALGALTKGLPSFMFLGFTTLGWLAWKRDWRRLLSAPFLLGSLLFLAIVGGYLYQYSRFHPLENLIAGLWRQNKEFTVLDNQSWAFFRHLYDFPLATLADLLPAGLLFVFLLRRDLWRVITRNELITFALITFLVNIPVYWFSPGARQRYIYMLYPFLVYLLLYAYRQAEFRGRWRSVFLQATIGLILAALALGAPAIYFIPDLDFLSYRLPLSIAGFLLFSALFYLFWKRRELMIPILILATILARLVFNLTVLPQRAVDSNAQRDKELAREVLAITRGAPLYIYDGQRISFSIVVYIDLWNDRYLRRDYRRDPKAYYFIEEATLPAEGAYESFTDFEYSGRPYRLIRFREP